MIIGVVGNNLVDIETYIFRNYDVKEFNKSTGVCKLINGDLTHPILEHEDVAGNVFDSVLVTPAYTSLIDYAKSKLRK